MLFVLIIGYVRICYEMESRAVADENTPGKPDRKTRRLSRNAKSSRALFQSPGTSPKVVLLYVCFTVNP